MHQQRIKPKQNQLLCWHEIIITIIIISQLLIVKLFLSHWLHNVNVGDMECHAIRYDSNDIVG